MDVSDHWFLFPNWQLLYDIKNKGKILGAEKHMINVDDYHSKFGLSFTVKILATVMYNNCLI